MQSLDKIKIGYTKNISKRKRALEIGNPHGIVVIGTVKGNIDHEHKIHTQLEQYIIQGEWVRDCPEVRQYISDILNNQKVVKYETHTIYGEKNIYCTSDPKWLNEFESHEQNNSNQINDILKKIRKIEIEINHLLANKKKLEIRYIKIIKGEE
tara:strand:- start:835 stop:1293 length:459 start_codon:yes stop_codon:yes gene_type:complete